MSQIPIQKTVFNKDNYPKVIDNKFKQLLNNTIEEETTEVSLEEFFQLYSSFFYQIPREGDINSHRYILEKEAEYLGVQLNEDNVQLLLDEITTLRQEVLDAQTLISTLNNTNGQ